MQDVRDIDWSSWQPQDRATLVFIVEGERVLLIHKQRGLGAGKINGPGGRLEAGETPLQCAIRETREEVCVEPQALTELGLLAFQFVDGYSLLVHAFRALGYVGTPTSTPEAIPEWFAQSALPLSRMWADDALWLPKLLAGQRVRGRFLFDNDRLLAHELDAPETEPHGSRWP